LDLEKHPKNIPKNFRVQDEFSYEKKFVEKYIFILEFPPNDI
jgi:hypothetical protein